MSWNFLWIRSTYCFKYFQCKIFWLFYVHCWFTGFIQDRVVKATIFAAKYSTSSHCTQNEVFHRGFLRICLHLLKKSLVENFIFCAVSILYLSFLFSDFTAQISDLLNPFWVDVPFLKPSQTSENFWFSDAFRMSRLLIFLFGWTRYTLVFYS